MKVNFDYCTDKDNYTATARRVSFSADTATEAIRICRVIQEERRIPPECVGQVTINGYAQRNIKWTDLSTLEN